MRTTIPAMKVCAGVQRHRSRVLMNQLPTSMMVSVFSLARRNSTTLPALIEHTLTLVGLKLHCVPEVFKASCRVLVISVLHIISPLPLE